MTEPRQDPRRSSAGAQQEVIAGRSTMVSDQATPRPAPTAVPAPPVRPAGGHLGTVPLSGGSGLSPSRGNPGFLLTAAALPSPSSAIRFVIYDRRTT
jgi:hypothetical protein